MAANVEIGQNAKKAQFSRRETVIPGTGTPGLENDWLMSRLVFERKFHPPMKCAVSQDQARAHEEIIVQESISIGYFVSPKLG